MPRWQVNFSANRKKDAAMVMPISGHAVSIMRIQNTARMLILKD